MNLINSSASLGGEIVGIKIDAKLTKDHIDFINTSWDERLVLVFKNQNVDDKTLINFSKNFISKTTFLALCVPFILIFIWYIAKMVRKKINRIK